jgi:hypothetical protein
MFPHIASLLSELENQNPEIALPNLSFISSNDNHQVISLLNKDNGVSHSKTSVPNIDATVIHAFFQKDILSLVKNLYNQ